MQSNFIFPCCLYKFNNVIHQLLTFRLEDTNILYTYAGCLMSMWCRKTESLSLLSAWPSGCRRCGFWTPYRTCVWLHKVYVNCVAFLPLNRFIWIAFGLRFFCTLKLTIFWLMLLFYCVYVLLICSYLLITGCKIVEIKTNTVCRSNDNSWKYYIYCQPTLQRS